MQNALEADAGQENQVKPRVLVVDDVADNRDILTRRLVRRDFEVVEASGGAEALEKLATMTFDIVLLDIMMPDISGNEVLRQIRQKFDASRLPVIMVTAKSQSEDVVESLGLGANDYVTKPVDFTVALARINAQLELKARADAEFNGRRSLEEQSRLLDARLDSTAKDLAAEAEKRQVTEERLRFLAYHDPLTGLMNRQGFRDHLFQVLDNLEVIDGEPALLFIDLDGFKAVNDSHGHEIGDMLLAKVGERLKALMAPNTPIARLGGDEFSTIIESRNQPEDAMAKAKVVVEALSEPFDLDGKSIRVGASCGVARAASFSGDLDGLIKAADLAMYHAKGNGTGHAVLFETRMLDEQRQRRLLEADLHHAVANNEFEVFYQPMVNAETRTIMAFEALLRWPHKTRGMMSPETFIPIAEETGLITQLGAWVLRQACEEAMNWPEDVSISVNISPLQFDSASLLPTLVNVLASTGLSPSRLELEITETALLGTEGKNVRVLEAIRELGVRVSIDDFGTGYSSLLSEEFPVRQNQDRPSFCAGAGHQRCRRCHCAFDHAAQQQPWRQHDGRGR